MCLVLHVECFPQRETPGYSYDRSYLPKGFLVFQHCTCTFTKHVHLCVPVYQLNCNCINSSVLPTTLLSPSMVSFDSPLFHLVRRPEPTVDQFWEKLRLVATVEIALASRRPEKGHLCIFLTRMWWLFFLYTDIFMII